MANVSIILNESYEPELSSSNDVRLALTYNVRLFSSRSVVETGERCRRKRYLTTMLGGKGISLKTVNFPLLTGSMVHEAIALLLQEHKNAGKVDKEFAAEVAMDTSKYKEDLVKRGYFEDGQKLPGELEYWFNEQSSLFSALVYAWYLIEYPALVAQYDVVDVEKDIALFVPIKSGDEYVCFESRADAILKVKDTDEIVSYNLKTSKSWRDRNRESFVDSLQSITETWALEKYISWVNLNLESMAEGLEGIIGNPKAANTIRGKRIKGHVSGVRLCVLRKGDTEYTTGMVYNGLIRPYRRVTGPTGELEYAVEYQFPEPLNKSGYGRLGQGWERFNIWESEEFTIVSWLDELMKGDIQPQLGANPLTNYVFNVPDYKPSKTQISQTMADLFASETTWAHIRHALQGKPVPVLHPAHRGLIGMSRQSCHFPTKCECYDVCYDEHVAQDPIRNSDLYEERTPHHTLEGE